MRINGRLLLLAAAIALFGRVWIDAETIRLLVFGLALVAIMLLRPAGLWPSAVRKRELEVARAPEGAE